MSAKKIQNNNLEPDEIFMDSKNIPGFERGRFEGRLEKPLPSKTFWYLSLTIAIVSGIFLYRAADLQLLNGGAFRARAEANRLKIVPIWPERGIIFDRNGKIIVENKPAFRLVLDTSELDFSANREELSELLKELAQKSQVKEEVPLLLEGEFKRQPTLTIATFSDWKEADKIKREYSDLLMEIEPFSLRSYKGGEATAHLTGYIGYPTAEDLRESNSRWQTLLGRTGIEETYNQELEGRVGSKLTEIDSQGEKYSEAIQEPSKNGRDLHLTIDLDLQKEVYKNIKALVDTRGFKGGSAILMDPKTGEILSLISYPSYDSELLSAGKPASAIERILNLDSKPLFNRAISGLYPAGSVIKPLIAVAALEENIITPERQIFSSGNISVPNPFQPSLPSIFYDWKAHGWVDMRNALAVSSNVYFYSIGGGYEDIPGLGIKKIQEWGKKFGFGEKSGIDLASEKEGLVPGPEWKAEFDKNDPAWRVGDTYNISIGQGNLQVTPLQIAVYVSAFANGGKIIEPMVLKSISDKNENIFEAETKIKRSLDLKEENLNVVTEGMELAARIGTAQAVSGLGVRVAGKTGTAEIGSGKNVNSWFMGFFPYENPRVALTIVLEGGSASNLVGASAASRRIIEWIVRERPELVR